MPVDRQVERLIAVGWDVRGWRSSEQAVAVASIENGRLEWVGIRKPFQFPPGSLLGLDSLLLPALGADWLRQVMQVPRIVVAIDAPLAFPSGLKRLIDHPAAVFVPTGTEIDNPLAYRYCERWVKETFDKKPFSAAFDKLGNNASLAICVARSLAEDGFLLAPQQVDDHPRVVIEVYPGIAKRGTASP